MKRALQRVEATFATLIPRRHSNFCYSTSTKLQADELSKPTKHRTDFITTNWRNESTRFLTTSQANGIWETFCTLEMPNKTFKFDLYTNVGKDLQNIKISEVCSMLHSAY
jgi:hypothetical protein